MALRTAKLAGIALTGHAPIKWGRQPGVQPFVSSILTSKRRAEAIFRATRGVPTTLELEGKRFAGLYVTSLMAGNGPHTRRLIVADWRWALPRIHLTLDCNMMRQSIERRLVGKSLEVASQAAAQVYAPSTLLNNQPFTAVKVLSKVTELLIKYLGEIDIPLVLGEFPPEVPTIEVVSWQLDGPGDESVGKLLGLMPGLQLDADDEGRLRWYLTTGTSELAQVKGTFIYANPGNQFPSVMERSWFRPRLTYVLFDKDMEQRFSYDEVKAFGSLQPTGNFTNPGFDLVNVVQVKEPNLSINGTPVGYGTWVTFQDYITALAQAPKPATVDPSNYPSITWVRTHFCSGFSRPRSLYLSGPSPDPLWAARFDTILSSYRQTFALSQYWYERLGGIEAIRTTVFDPVRNIRAPSEVYMNYTLKPTWRQVSPYSGGSSEDWGAVVDTCYNGGAIDASKPAPFTVEVEDHDAMIVRLVPRPELSRQSDLVFPGTPEVMVAKDSPAWINSAISSGGFAQSLWEHVVLSRVFQLTLVLSVRVANPNDRTRYHVEQVTPVEAQTVIKAVRLGECLGPPVYLRVDPGFLTARSTWLDSQAAGLQQAILGDPIPTSCLQNPEQLKDVAVAAAGRVYESLADRLAGEGVQVKFAPDMKLQGSLAGVVHQLDPSGHLTTAYSFAQQVDPRDLLAYLPTGTRRVLQKAAQNLKRR